MTLNSKPSTPDSPNTDQVIDSADLTETAWKLLEDYYESKIDHNHPNFHVIWKIAKEECKALRARIYLFNESNLPF